MTEQEQEQEQFPCKNCGQTISEMDGGAHYEDRGWLCISCSDKEQAMTQQEQDRLLKIIEEQKREIEDCESALEDCHATIDELSASVRHLMAGRPHDYGQQVKRIREQRLREQEQ